MPKHLSHNGRRRTTGRWTADAPRARHRKAAEPVDDPLHSLADSVAELRDQMKGLAQVKLDQLDLAVRNRTRKLTHWGLLLMTSAVVAAVAVGFIFYAVALLMIPLCGDRPWLAFLLTGSSAPAVFLTAAFALHVRARRRHRRRLEEKYADARF